MLLFLVIVEVFVGFFADPYNIFHADYFRDNGISPNRHYIKMSYLLNYPKKYNALLFGNSCVSAIHVEKIDDVRCYNMTYSYGVPAEHLQNIKTLLDNNVQIDRIYIGVDADSCARSAEKNKYDPLRCQYENIKGHPLHTIRLYFDPSMLLRSVKIMCSYMLYGGDSRFNGGPVFRENFYDSGSTTNYGRKGNTVWEPSMIALYEALYEAKPFSIDVLRDINSIVELCKKESIELVVFTNPMHQVPYKASTQFGYLDFLKGLADVTDFYNFSGLNTINVDNNNFLDFEHYKAEIGDLMIDVMYHGKRYDELYKQGFGWKVTKDNVQEFLNLPEISGSNI